MGGGGGHPAPPHPFILQNCVLVFKARFSSVRGPPVQFLCLIHEDGGPETNCTAKYELSFKKQHSNIKWPWFKWKPHSYCKKKVIPAGVIVTTH